MSAPTIRAAAKTLARGRFRLAESCTAFAVVVAFVLMVLP